MSETCRTCAADDFVTDEARSLHKIEHHLSLIRKALREIVDVLGALRDRG